MPLCLFIINYGQGVNNLNDNNQLQDDLITYIKNGKPKQLRNEIASRNIGLMYSGLKATGIYNIGTKDFEDIEQEGFILFLKAIESYDLERECNFSSYWYIFAKNIFRNTESYGVYYTNGDYINMLSLDKPVANGEEENTTLGELIEDRNNITPDEALEVTAFNEVVRGEVNRLPVEQANLIYNVYGIGKEEQEEMYISDYAKSKGITYNKAIEIKNIAHYSLRTNQRLRELAYEYNEITNIKATRFDRMGTSRTNNISDPTSRTALKRLEMKRVAERLAKSDDKYKELLSKLQKINCI